MQEEVSKSKEPQAQMQGRVREHDVCTEQKIFSCDQSIGSVGDLKLEN